MKFFRRKSMKSGYCNISEPVSDLDPVRVSEIKAQHFKLTEKKKRRAVSSNDETFVTENVTLDDTSPSALASLGSSSKSIGEKKALPDLPEASKSETEEVQTAPLPPVASFPDAAEYSVSEGADNISTLKQHVPKTPDTFFGGKNRKRIPIRLDSSSQAPTEHPIAALAMQSGEREESAKIVHVPKTTTNDFGRIVRSNNIESQSQTSDLDKSFSPQIVSVNSDITDPSYGVTRRKKKPTSHQPSWRKLKKLRRYLQETMNSKSGTCSSSSRNRKQQQQQNPLSFLDSMIDAICNYPPVDKRSS